MSFEGARSADRDRAGGWVEVLARLGYAAKGILYVAVGVLSAWAGLAGGGGARGSREVLADLAVEPFGKALLVFMAVGLAGYVTWRLVQALLDPEQAGSDGKGLAKRGAWLVSAAVYGGLGVWVVRALVEGMRSVEGGGGGGATGTWSQRLLAEPWGAWLLGAAGLAVAGYGVAEFVRVYRRSWERRLRPDLSGEARRWAGRAARFGLIARGVVLLIVGGFVLWTAYTADPSRARGMEGALAALRDEGPGVGLMAVVALGLAAYGVFQLVKAWYRRIGPVG